MESIRPLFFFNIFFVALVLLNFVVFTHRGAGLISTCVPCCFFCHLHYLDFFCFFFFFYGDFFTDLYHGKSPLNHHHMGEIVWNLF